MSVPDLLRTIVAATQQITDTRRAQEPVAALKSFVATSGLRVLLSTESPGRRETMRRGSVLPHARSNAAITSSTEHPRPMPRLSVVTPRSRESCASAATWPSARSITWM